MTIETITTKKLMASEGMTLTNGEVYGKIIYLASSDNEKDYNEITDAEYEEILKEESAEVQDEVI